MQIANKSRASGRLRRIFSLRFLIACESQKSGMKKATTMVIKKKNKTFPVATKSVLTNQRHDRPSVSSALARASRVTCSKRAVCADDRGSIRRNSSRKPIKDPSTSAIVIAVISLDFDVNNLADNENTDHHHDHTKVNHVQTGW